MHFPHATINEVMLWRFTESASGTAFFVEDEAGGFSPVSFASCRKEVLALAAALRHRGLDAGDRIGLLSDVRQEWTHCDFAHLLGRLITVGIYPTTTPDQVEYILRHSEARLLIVDTPERLDTLGPTLAACPQLEGVILMEGTALNSVSLPVQGLADLLEAGHRILDEQGEQPTLDEAHAARPEDTISLVYTSGTTGPPKGVVLTHGNLFHVCESVTGLLPYDESDRGLVYLPLAHILQRYVTYLGLRIGGSGYYVSDLTTLPAAMQAAQPTILAAVPRVLEKIQAKAMAAREALSGFGRSVFDWAFAVGAEVAALARVGREPKGWLAYQHRLADRLVLRKVRAKLGGCIKLVVSGGAPLAPHLSEWFHAAGLLVVEGYGLTETSAPATTNTPSSYRFGTVGQAIPGTDVRIAADGEIEIRGPGVFAGYFKDEEASTEAFTTDGFFRSGDIGVLDSEGFLCITGRKKNIIITAGGKNIGPGRIENLLKEHLLVGQAMVYGDRKPYLICLLALDPEDAPAWAATEGIDASSLPELSRHPRVLAAIADHMDQVNAQLASYETLKYFEVVSVPFLPENGYLTPTLKLKRRAILANFGTQLEAIYLRATGEALPPVGAD